MPSPPEDHTWKEHEVDIDLDVAPPTRIADHIDGGESNFAVDREVAEHLVSSVPSGIEGFRAVSRAGQAFLERVVHHLVVDCGVRQFLATGSKLTGEPNVHDIAQGLARESRIVYLVLDPVTLAHAHTLRSRTPEGVTGYIPARLRDTDEILRRAAATLDLSQPVGVLLPASLAFVRKDSTAYEITAKLMAGVAPGSYLVVTHHASDLFVEEHREMYRTIEQLAAKGKTWGVTARSRDGVTRFFDGFELIEPGVVPVDEWRLAAEEREAIRGAIWAAVGRKPAP